MTDWTRMWGARLLASYFLVACGGSGSGGGSETEADTETGSGPGSGTAGESPGNPTADESSGDETGESDAPVDVEFLTPSEHLVRVSMALRGVRPAPAEVDAVRADPEALTGLVDGYLDSPAFGRTVMNLHNEALLVEPDYAYYPAGFPNVGVLADRDFYEINRDIMQAPLRLVEHVVMNDRPYSEVVTADYTLANDTVATVWDIPYQGGGEWEVTAWDDGRDNAGVLSDSWLFQRHRSTESNANRGRANLVASAFLCADFTSTDVDIDVSVDLSDPEVVADAVLENPSCAVCHVQLDPLASYFRGFYPLYVPQEQEGEATPYPMELPWYEEFFPELLGVPMLPAAYYGEEGDGLAFLGEHIAQDPRFASCAVRRFWSYLHQTSLEAVPDDAFDAFEPGFAAGLDTKALVKAIVLSDDFRTASVRPADGDDPTDAEIEMAARVGMLKARPQALGSMVEDLTGFRWVADFSSLIDEETGEPVNLGRVPLLEDSFLGYRVLGGGIDSMFVTQAAHTYNAPNLLVLTTLAREAAHYEVEQAIVGQGSLLTAAPDTVGETAVRAELVELHRRLYAADVEPDDPDIDAGWTLFEAALGASADSNRAWKTTLTALLADLRIAFY
ncbi:MAG: hypothetical protein KUG77_16485 [Nannocystaceae bacterium]|nr:hypothetical protein [Nannocystaceae bacterium]